MHRPHNINVEICCGPLRLSRSANPWCISSPDKFATYDMYWVRPPREGGCRDWRTIDMSLPQARAVFRGMCMPPAPFFCMPLRIRADTGLRPPMQARTTNRRLSTLKPPCMRAGRTHAGLALNRQPQHGNSKGSFNKLMRTKNAPEGMDSNLFQRS